MRVAIPKPKLARKCMAVNKWRLKADKTSVSKILHCARAHLNYKRHVVTSSKLHGTRIKIKPALKCTRVGVT